MGIRSLIIDQATVTMGFAVVEECADTPVSYGVTGKLLYHGRLTTEAKLPLNQRLTILKDDLRQIINKSKPDEIVIENTLCFRQRTGNTNQAMGAAYQACHDLAEEFKLGFYTQHPASIKVDITGDGHADKQKVKESVAHKWGLPVWKLRDDNHADALAGAFRWLVMSDSEREKQDAKRKGRRR